MPLLVLLLCNLFQVKLEKKNRIKHLYLDLSESVAVVAIFAISSYAILVVSYIYICIYTCTYTIYILVFICLYELIYKPNSLQLSNKKLLLLLFFFVIQFKYFFSVKMYYI